MTSWTNDHNRERTGTGPLFPFNAPPRPSLLTRLLRWLRR